MLWMLTGIAALAAVLMWWRKHPIFIDDRRRHGGGVPLVTVHRVNGSTKIIHVADLDGNAAKASGKK